MFLTPALVLVLVLSVMLSNHGIGRFHISKYALRHPYTSYAPATFDTAENFRRRAIQVIILAREERNGRAFASLKDYYSATTNDRSHANRSTINSCD